MSDEASMVADALLECGLCHRHIHSRRMAEHIAECALKEHPTTDRFD
jgi:hypothetical protein